MRVNPATPINNVCVNRLSAQIQLRPYTAHPIGTHRRYGWPPSQAHGRCPQQPGIIAAKPCFQRWERKSKWLFCSISSIWTRGLEGPPEASWWEPPVHFTCRGGIIEIHLIIVPSLALNENCLLGSSILIYASLILSGPHKWTLYWSHLDRNAAKCHIWQRRTVDAVALPWLSLFYPRRSRQLFCVSLLGVASFSQYIFLSILI